MGDCIMDLHVLESGTQCFPRYLYDGSGKQKDGITDAALEKFQARYQTPDIEKDHIFNYIYAILHSPGYRATWANNLAKELPRIPFSATREDFFAFAAAGKQLGDLHCAFDSAAQYQDAKIDILKKGCTTLQDLQAADFRVEKMKHGKQGGSKDRTTIHYNPHITLRNIPEEAYDYVVNGKSAIAWVMERQAIRTDKASGIVSDANRYAVETAGNPRYPLELLLRIITVSLKTLHLVKTLPAICH